MKEQWKRYKLGQVCRLVNGRAYSRRELLPQGKYPVLRVGNFFTNTGWYYSDLALESDKYCDKGDLLYAWSASFGPHIWTGEKVIFHYHIWKVLPDPCLTDKNFLFWWFLWDRDRIKEDHGTGTTMIHVAKGSMEDREIVVPPLPEQRRIVGVLDEAFDGIATAKANAEKNLQNARAIFQSHLQSVLMQRGNGWVEKPIGDVCVLRSGTTLPPEIEKPSGEIPYLKVADMNIGENLNGITRSSRYVNKRDVNASNLLPEGTTIFPKRGGAILTNKKRLTMRVICADLNIMGVTPKQDLLPEFLFNFFLRLDLREINNGSSIPQINNYSIEPIIISFPKSITAQQKIVDNLSSLAKETQTLENIYQRKLAALESLKKSLLHQAFTDNL
jgi:type I restriction enzyme, S subunit